MSDSITLTGQTNGTVTLTGGSGGTLIFQGVSQGIKGDKGDQGDPATNLVTSVAGKTGAVSLTKDDVGLSNVDNTSDADKPVSTATQTALDAKATITALDAHTNNTANPHSVTKAQVGLGNVQNLAPADMPVSTDTQTALDAKANASDTVNLTGDQTVAGVKTFTSAPIAPSGTSIGGALYLSGTGFPNGVVTAPVGSVYIDKNITNGASSWIKKSGTGNTGWRVLEGDTGWRNIGSITGINEQIKIRRSGPNVYFSQIGDAITINSTVSLSRLALPAGFRSSLRQISELIATSGAKYGTMLVKSTEADLILTTTGTATLIAFGNGSFITNEDWPTTLPGVSA